MTKNKQKNTGKTKVIEEKNKIDKNEIIAFYNIFSKEEIKKAKKTLYSFLRQKPKNQREKEEFLSFMDLNQRQLTDEQKENLYILKEMKRLGLKL